MSRELDIYRMVKIGMKTLKRARIPLYWSKGTSLFSVLS